MRKMLIVLMLLVPVAVWGADKKTSQEQLQKAEKKAEQDQLKNELEEDICFAQSEFLEASNVSFKMTGGSYSSTSPGARYARDADIKRARLNALVKRYSKRYSEAFDVNQCIRRGR